MSRYWIPLLLLALSACRDGHQEPGSAAWELLAQYPLSVPEPSGLCLDRESGSLYTVSDETGLVYRMDLEGHVLQTLSWTGDDPEGICIDPRDGSLWVVVERRRQLVRLSRAGSELERWNMDLPGAANSGLEGVAVEPDGHALVVQEKDPGQLLRWLPGEAELEVHPLDFARDYSGLCHDPERNRLYVLSDESEILVRLDAGGIEKRWDLGLRRLEGVAIDGDIAYLVSDALARLFVIQLHEHTE